MAGSERCDNVGRLKKEQDNVVVECCECGEEYKMNVRVGRRCDIAWWAE